MTALLSAMLYSRLRQARNRNAGAVKRGLDQFVQRALDRAMPIEAHRRMRVAIEPVVAEALSFGEAPNRGWRAAVALDEARRGMLRIYAEALSPALRDLLRQHLAEPVRRGVRPIRELLLPTLRAAADPRRPTHTPGRCFGAPRWVGTAALIDYLRRVLDLPLDRRFPDTVERCGLFWPLDRVCVAAERPSYLNRDEAGEPHCEVGPSLAYPSGWGWWHWHGVRVAQNVIEAPETITVAAIHAAGPQARRVMFERYRAGEPVSGIAAYLRDSGARLLDRDPAFGSLWRIDTGPAAPMLMLEVENRSPEPDGGYRHFLLRVDPELRPLRQGGFGRWQPPTARNAAASTFGLTGAEYRPKVET